MLRPEPLPADAIRQWEAGMVEATFTLNDWQMRDRERSTAKPQGIAFRSFVIGDSLLDEPPRIGCGAGRDGGRSDRLAR